jgi:hypothetical protein
MVDFEVSATLLSRSRGRRTVGPPTATNASTNLGISTTREEGPISQAMHGFGDSSNTPTRQENCLETGAARGVGPCGLGGGAQFRASNENSNFENSAFDNVPSVTSAAGCRSASGGLGQRQEA